MFGCKIMSCSYVLTDSTFEGFGCNRLAAINGMCHICYERSIIDEIENKNRTLCLFTLTQGEYASFTCRKYANEALGFCDRCCKSIGPLRLDKNLILNSLCGSKNHENVSQ